MADEEIKKKPKKTSRPTKVRVKLSTIDSYSKTLEFPCEAPGRVVVRLERLTGSDKIRPTDPKFLSTLGEQLEAEESVAWGSKSTLRKKAEKNRSRQLAIDGLMEPSEEMQDLYNHPVFRVNRVLRRLNAFDANFVDESTGKPPKITPVEPFEEDETGAIFKNYPSHKIFAKSYSPSPTVTATPESPSKTTAQEEDDSRPKTRRNEKDSPEDSTSVLYKTDKTESTSRAPSGTDRRQQIQKKYARNQRQPEESSTTDMSTSVPESANSDERLLNYMRQYGVPSDEDLADDWTSYRSLLVDAVYEDTGGSAADLYELAGQVIGTYERQIDTVDYYLEQITPQPEPPEDSREEDLPDAPPPTENQEGKETALADGLFQDDYDEYDGEGGETDNDNPPDLDSFEE